MEFGLFTCGYQHLPLETAFYDAKAFGYDYIELWGGRPHAFASDLLAGDASKIRDLIQKYQMPVYIYTPEHNAYPYNYMLGTERQWEESMNYLSSAFRAASDIGAQYTLVSIGHGGSATPNQRKQRLERSLYRLCAAAEEAGQTILLETLTPYESNTCTRLEDLREILDKIDSPALLGMCDVVPPFVQKEDPVDYARVLGKRMGHLHLVDNDGQSDSHLLPGDGIMPLRKIIRELREAGYDGMATIELVTNYMSDPSFYAELALNRVKELL